MARFCDHGIQKNSCSICDSSAVYQRYQREAERRDKPFGLTEAEFTEIVSRPCHYCKTVGRPRGVDRINNYGFYEPSNSQSLCWVCNKIKGTFSEDFLYQHIEQMHFGMKANKEKSQMSISNIVSQGFVKEGYVVSFQTHRGDIRSYLYSHAAGIEIAGGADPAQYSAVETESGSDPYLSFAKDTVESMASEEGAGLAAGGEEAAAALLGAV